ncbi:MAG: hypothetical protein ACREJC_15595 [Tepidisphaeraceae bacterium]
MSTIPHVRPHDSTLTVALCASLVVHVGVLVALAELFAGQRIDLPGYAMSSLQTPVNSPLIVPVPRPDEQLGDTEGTGTASDASPGEQPLLARAGPQDQPMLGRDPVGPSVRNIDPSESVFTPGADGSMGSGPPKPLASPAEPQASERQPVLGVPPEPQDALPKTEPAPLPEGISADAPSKERVENREAPEPAQPAHEEPQPKPSPAEEPAPQTPDANPGAPGPRGAPAPAADVAPQGESDSDAFSTTASAEFRPGSTRVRFGRKHKLTRPHIDLAANVDLITMSRPVVVLKLRTDSTGKVVSAEIAQSSGSENIDQPCRVTAYEWWFEPKKDASGRPRGETIFFTIRFY